MVAMVEAVKQVKERKLKKVKIWTDSKALVESLKRIKISNDKMLVELKEMLIEESGKADISVCWIPGHVGVEGNEKADKEANSAREMTQEDAGITINGVEAKLKEEIKYKPSWDERMKKMYGKGIKRETNSRELQVLMAKLRSGHCPKTKYYAKG